VLVALIVLVAIAAVEITGDQVGSMFDHIADRFASIAN
jgi:hypothetical protein